MKKLIQNCKDIAKENCLPVGLSIAIVAISFALTFVLYNEKEVKKRGYQVEISPDGKRVVRKEKVIDLKTALKTADFDRGKKIFRKCASCHNIKKGAGAKVGPNLWGIVNRKKGTYPGFTYSKALLQKGGRWDLESINQFIQKPRNYIPGTKMAFGGLKKAQARADVILYLQKAK